MVRLPSVDRFSGKERFAIGVVLTIVVQAMTFTGVSLFRFGGFLQLLAWAFLGTALLPPFVNYLDAEKWSDISTGKQIVVLWIAGVGALILWFAVTFATGTVFEIIA